MTKEGLTDQAPKKLRRLDADRVGDMAEHNDRDFLLLF